MIIYWYLLVVMAIIIININNYVIILCHLIRNKYIDINNHNRNLLKNVEREWKCQSDKGEHIKNHLRSANRYLWGEHSYKGH